MATEHTEAAFGRHRTHRSKGARCRLLGSGMAADQIALFQSSDGVVSLPVHLESESVWLTQAQMAQLFGKERTVIGKHIRNAIREGEVDASTGCANFAYPVENAAGTVKVAAYDIDSDRQLR